MVAIDAKVETVEEGKAQSEAKEESGPESEPDPGSEPGAENNNPIDPNDSAYSNSTNSKSRRSRSSKSTNSGSNSSGSSGYGGKQTDSNCTFNSNSNSSYPAKTREKRHREKSSPEPALPSIPEELLSPPPPPPRPPSEFAEPGAKIPKIIIEEVPPSPEPPIEPVPEGASEQVKPIPDEVSLNENEGAFWCMISMEDGVVVFTTPSITDVLLFPKDMWLGRSFIDFVHPWDKDSFTQHISKCVMEPMRGKEKGTSPGGIAQETGKADPTMFCRIRCYRNLASGYSIKTRDTIYKPFRLKISVKHVQDDSGDNIYLVLKATPFESFYKSPSQIVQSAGPFILRHTAKGIIESLGVEAVPFMGFFPQDLLGKDVLELYHTEDMHFIKEIYEIIVKDGVMPRCRPFRMQVHNGGYIKLQTEWSSFINPWSKKLEFISGKHYIIEGPKNPNVFEPPKIAKMKNFTDIEKTTASELRVDIIKMMAEKLSKPAHEENVTMAQRCKYLASYMENIIRDQYFEVDSHYNGRDNAYYYEREIELMGGLSTHNDQCDDASSSKTPLSYTQLNYNENLLRYFDKFDPEKLIPLMTDPSTMAIPTDENHMEVVLSPVGSPVPYAEQRLRPSSACDPELIGEFGDRNAMDEIGEIGVAVNRPVGFQCPRLTKLLIIKHNQEMEKRLINKHRDARFQKKNDHNSHVKTKLMTENIARCKAILEKVKLGDEPKIVFDPSPHGKKRTSQEAFGGPTKYQCVVPDQMRPQMSGYLPVYHVNKTNDLTMSTNLPINSMHMGQTSSTRIDLNTVQMVTANPINMRQTLPMHIGPLNPMNMGQMPIMHMGPTNKMNMGQTPSINIRPTNAINIEKMPTSLMPPTNPINMVQTPLMHMKPMNLMNMGQTSSMPKGPMSAKPAGPTSTMPPSPTSVILPGATSEMPPGPTSPMPPSPTAAVPPGPTSPMPSSPTAAMPPGPTFGIPPGPSSSAPPGPISTMPLAPTSTMPLGPTSTMPLGPTSSMLPGPNSALTPGRTSAHPGPTSAMRSGFTPVKPSNITPMMPPGPTSALPPGLTSAINLASSSAMPRFLTPIMLSGSTTAMPRDLNPMMPPGPTSASPLGPTSAMALRSSFAMPPFLTPIMLPGPTTAMPRGLTPMIPPGPTSAMPPGLIPVMTPGPIAALPMGPISLLPSGPILAMPPKPTFAMPPGLTPGPTVVMPPGLKPITNEMPPTPVPAMPPDSLPSMTSASAILSSPISEMPRGPISEMPPMISFKMPTRSIFKTPRGPISEIPSGPSSAVPSNPKSALSPSPTPTMSLSSSIPMHMGAMANISNMPISHSSYIAMNSSSALPTYSSASMHMGPMPTTIMSPLHYMATNPSSKISKESSPLINMGALHYMPMNPNSLISKDCSSSMPMGPSPATNMGSLQYTPINHYSSITKDASPSMPTDSSSSKPISSSPEKAMGSSIPMGETKTLSASALPYMLYRHPAIYGPTMTYPGPTQQQQTSEAFPFPVADYLVEQTSSRNSFYFGLVAASRNSGEETLYSVESLKRVVSETSEAAKISDNSSSIFTSFNSSLVKSDTGGEDNSDQKSKQASLQSVSLTSWSSDEKSFANDSDPSKKLSSNPNPEPPRTQKVNLTPDVIYRYQVPPRDVKEVLEEDKEKISRFKQPPMVNDQLGQLYLDLQLQGVAAKLTLEEGITSSGSSSEEINNKNTNKNALHQNRDYTKLAMIYEEDALMPSPDEETT